MKAWLLPLALLAGACSKAAPDPADSTAAVPLEADDVPAAKAPDLAGTAWRIDSVDGQPARAIGTGPTTSYARINFGQTGYGGTSGCNSFGGLGAQLKERYFAIPPLSTMIGCGPLTGQESAILAVFAAPADLVSGPGEQLTMRGGGHVLVLSPDVLGGKLQPPQRDFPQVDLAGSTWNLLQVNDRRSVTPSGQLSFAADRVRLTGDCPAMTGSWAQKKRFLAISVLQPACANSGAAMADLAAILTSAPRVVTGPNGEMLLASEAGWAILQRR